MSTHANRFYSSIKNAGEIAQVELIAFFVYHLTSELGAPGVTPSEVDSCFIECDLSPPSNTSARMSEGLKSKPKKYLKINGKYKLHRSLREKISKGLGVEVLTSQTSATLRSLEAKFPDGEVKRFLTETIDCFEVGANRATVIMAWLLTLDHLQEYILKHQLTAFNAALAKNTDRRVKITCVTTRDDFSEIPESKFIEFCRASKIISNDVRKILDQKLSTRNSAAHPSGVTIGKVKTIEFVEDLVLNVILKFSQ